MLRHIVQIQVPQHQPPKRADHNMIAAAARPVCSTRPLWRVVALHSPIPAPAGPAFGCGVRRGGRRPAGAAPTRAAAAAEESSGVTTTVAAEPSPQHTWVWRGYKVRYVTAGCGKPVLLVHGFGASSGHWKRTIPALVEAGYKVTAIDLLGFGASEKPLIDYSMELWDQQLRDFMAEFCSGPAVLVGNSVGSLATLMAAAAAPDRVAGVVLLNCAGGMNNKAVGSAEDWRIRLATPLLLLIDYLLKQPAVARFLFDKFRTRDNIRKVLLGVYPSNPEAVDQELVELLYEPSCDVGALETFVSCITGPPGPRPEVVVEQLKAPLLIMWGDRDNFTPSDGPVGQFFKALPAQRAATSFVPLPGVGHCPMDEAPDAVNAQLLPWLAQIFSS